MIMLYQSSNWLEHFIWCIYLFGVLHCFQHYTIHITTGSWKGRGNQYIQLIKILYRKLPTNSKQLPTLPLESGPGTKPQPQRREATLLPLCHRGSLSFGVYWRCVPKCLGAWAYDRNALVPYSIMHQIYHN